MRILILLSCLFAFNTISANEFSSCIDAELLPELKSSQCITVTSPLTYQDNDTETIELFVRKFPSLKNRTGSIWLIAGGPGESGASFYSIIDLYRTSFPNFDIFIPDHRGTGASSTICPEESVNSIGGKHLVGKEWGTCFSHMYSNLNYVKSFNITNAAKDLRLLINKLSKNGERFVYGISYGTQLTLRLAQLDNAKLDGIILDSLVPMQNDKDFDLSNRSQVVNLVGQTLLDKCQTSTLCSGQNSVQLKQQLASFIKENKSLKDFSKELPDTPLARVLGIMLDIPHLRNSIPNIIYSLSIGDATRLISSTAAITTYYDKFNRGYTNYGSSIPLVQVITASENNLRPERTKTEVIKEAENLLFTSPLPQLIAENSMPTYDKDIHYAKLPTKLPKTLILHGTLDPKTHYSAAKKHARELAYAGQVSFIDIIDSPHFVALNAPTCFKKSIKEFIHGELIKHRSCLDKNTLVKF